MLKADVQSRIRVGNGRIVKLRIGVPRNHIDMLCHFKIVQIAVSAHQIGGNRNIRRIGAKHRRFVIDKIAGIPRRKAHPIEIQAMNTNLAERTGRIDLVKIVKGMTPKRCPPLMVELTYVVMVFSRKNERNFCLHFSQ